MTLPTVALLHGLATSSRRTWVDTGWVDILADEGRSTTLINLPGHGPGTHSVDPEHYASFDDEVAAQLPDEPCDAVGFSLGARTLLRLASQTPARFRRIVVAGVGDSLFSPDGNAEMLATHLEGVDVDDPIVNHFRQLASSSGVEVGVLRAILRRPDAGRVDPEMLSRITAPTLVVLGDRDFAGAAGPVADAIGHATALTLAGVDHFGTPKSFDFIDAALKHLGATE